MENGRKELEKMIALTKQKIKFYRKIPGTDDKLKKLYAYYRILDNLIGKNKNHLF